MPKAQAARPSLPASSSDFALPTSSSLNSLQNSSVDDFNPLLFRFRRPSLLAPQYLSDRIGSPLASSFTLAMPRPSSESDIDRSENMWTDSSPSSSENATPPLQGSGGERDTGADIDTNMQTSRPQTPPRASSSSNMGITSTESIYHSHIRRLSHPPKIPRILDLLSESKPDENEVKSEAQFQRLVASFSELPTQPRTPRAPSDRGRYPEEAGEDLQREDTPSDDGEDDEDFSFAPPPASEPISISKPRTPVQSAAGSINGDDLALDSPVCGTAMDIDMPSSTYGSPSVPTGAHQWRYTPPPTASAVRTNKRKYDDRFDPYPTASKRRAVSPSISYLRDTHNSLSPIYIPRSSSRPIPIPIANSNGNSVTSSPTVGNSALTISRPSFGSASVASSPTLRASMSLASPIARPLRLNGRKGETEDKEIDGAGEGVGGLRL
ncbi:hypothetical protein EWM64_g8016 [Hericium alpestre]|uniref:Uncharacterized protein n=1 Tax=Hericium alpestre TaxID=135208 RepID=A0A4Y9ZP15_9AGAM|nr:hypothetical protein EWM64_g8016 [Hericium alpestre]